MSEEPDFDRFRDSYASEMERAISFAGAEHEAYTVAKVNDMLSRARTRFGDIDTLRVLDVGCGVGVTDAVLGGHFGSLHGVDVSAPMIERARAANPTASYQTYDGTRLPYRDGEMDIAFAICVFHHVDVDARAALLAEMARVVRPGGLVLVYEHNPYNPLTRLVVSRCAFDEGVTLVRPSDAKEWCRAAGLADSSVRYLIFFPWRLRVLLRVERGIGRVPLGAQYVIAAAT